jgi:hypothetical protein
MVHICERRSHRAKEKSRPCIYQPHHDQPAMDCACATISQSSATRYIVNAGLPPEWKHLAIAIDRNDVQHANDLKVVEFVQNASRTGKYVRHNLNIPIEPDHRLLAKLALGIGYKVLASKFLTTEYASLLRQGMREKDHRNRAKIPIRGVGFLNAVSDKQFKLLAFPGAWISRKDSWADINAGISQSHIEASISSRACRYRSVSD